MMTSLAYHLRREVGLPVDYNKRYVQIDETALALTIERRPFGLEIRYLYVKPDLRGLGLGQDLMESLCRWAGAYGVAMRLWTKPFACRDRSPYSLVPFYTRFGFEPRFIHRRQGWHSRVRMHRG